MSHPHSLLLVTNANPKIGLGPLMRSLSLAEAWRKTGGEVQLVCDRVPATLARRIQRDGIEFSPVTRPRLWENLQLEQTARFDRAAWVANNAPLVDPAQLKSQLSGLPIVCFDLGEHAFGTSGSEFQTKGPEYVVIRQELSQFFQQGSEQPERVRRILVHLTEDSTNRLKIDELLSAMEPSIDYAIVDIVLPPNSTIESDRTIKRFNNLSVRLHRNIDRLVSLLCDADMAIATPGNTAFELARTGIPILMPCFSDHDSIVAGWFQKHDAASVVTMRQNGDIGQFTHQFVTLFSDSALRDQLACNARLMIDGNGANRIALMMARQFGIAVPEELTSVA